MFVGVCHLLCPSCVICCTPYIFASLSHARFILLFIIARVTCVVCATRAASETSVTRFVRSAMPFVLHALHVLHTPKAQQLTRMSVASAKVLGILHA